MTAAPRLLPTHRQAAELAAALADRLAACGDLTRPEWRHLLLQVPRHLFVPDRAWCVPDGPGAPYGIDRTRDPDQWLRAAYADAAIVTQVNDGHGDPGTGEGAWTSSLSAPGAVIAFLELLAPRDHERVLDVGTGPGWTAALLSARLGDGRVVSIEVDEQVAEQAKVNLEAAGARPRLVVADGAAGWAEGAPYDQVHVTCGVTTVPYAWVEQTRPGGTIVLPWMPEYLGGYKARLTVTGDGRAIGRLGGPASYMMLRSQRSGGLAEPASSAIWEETTPIDPRAVAQDSCGADIAIAGLLPDVLGADSTTGDGRFCLLLADAAATSWARVEHRPGRREHLVYQAGPRRLWQEVTDAYFRWVGWGRPGRDRFGLTVTPAGQYVWLDEPDRPLPGGSPAV
ncbi:methyltransferase domain-containing protein [uncultured Thermomonospora sp.]|uniref:methyltransferase domain-containing protein n=1 Tax=uncultured Thermomonospora sp. TaxID=671175 RepID=UPI00259BCF44|nr:methyltransferase domain-containing protein [uncultured Thermomonospora sp.]